MKLLLAHGSSDATHAREVTRLAERVTALLGEEVAVAFLSDARLPEGAIVLPLFLGEGVHVTEDAPQLAEQSGATLLAPLGSHGQQIAALVTTGISATAIFLIYQSDGFTALQSALHPFGEIACLHGEPSLSDLLKQYHSDTPVTVQPLLLFPGRSLARARRIIDDSGMTHVDFAPVLCECSGFAELVADCFRSTK